jgi:hypothetical protein
MVAIANEEMRVVLSQVSSWPVSDRIMLARKILETVETAPPRATRGYSAEEVISLLAMPQPAPDDAECRRILAEELVRKHG